MFFLIICRFFKYERPARCLVGRSLKPKWAAHYNKIVHRPAHEQNKSLKDGLGDYALLHKMLQQTPCFHARPKTR